MENCNEKLHSHDLLMYGSVLQVKGMHLGERAHAHVA